MKQDVRPAGRKFTLVALAQYADGEGVAYPGQKKLSKITSQSERAVRGHLIELEKGGYLRKSYRAREDGTRTSDEYKLNPPPAESAASEDQPPATNVETTGRICRALNKSVNKPDSTPPYSPPPPSGAAYGTEPKKRKTRLAPDWEPNAQHVVLGSELGFDGGRVYAEVPKFRDHADMHGRLLVDWDKGFNSWLRKAAEFDEQRPTGNRPAGGLSRSQAATAGILGRGHGSG